MCPEQTETEDEYEKLRKGVYGVNLEDVWSPQSQVKKDHAEYHKHLEEAKTNHKEYNRLQRRAVARFKQDTKHDHKQANFHRSYSSGLFPEQHGELMEPVSKWEESGYKLVSRHYRCVKSDADYETSCSHANARADHLLQHPFGFQSVAIKNTHLKKTESVYRDHLQAQEAYNLHAQYAPYVAAFFPTKSPNYTKCSIETQQVSFEISKAIRYQEGTQLQAVTTDTTINHLLGITQAMTRYLARFIRTNETPPRSRAFPPR